MRTDAGGNSGRRAGAPGAERARAPGAAGPATGPRVPAVQLTARDRAILQDVVRFGALTCDQLVRRHFGAASTAYHRLAALVATGYLEHLRVLFRAPGVYVATPRGAALAGTELPAARPAAPALAHHLAVADLADWLLARHDGATWVTERELRREAMLAVRGRSHGRLFAGTPHVPDGVLLLPPDPTGGVRSGARAAGPAGPVERVAVELEATAKTKTRYEDILRWYRGALGYRRVAWFCATGALQRRLEAVVREGRLESLVSVERLPAGVEVAPWG